MSGSISGISGLPQNRLLIGLPSGEQHVFTHIRTIPTYDHNTSVNLTKAVRLALKDACKQVNDVVMTPRVIGYDLFPSVITGGSTLLAASMEPLNLHDLSIPRENLREHTVVMIDLGGHLDALKVDDEMMGADMSLDAVSGELGS